MTTKFLWGDLRASAPQLFGRGGDRPHGVGAYVTHQDFILYYTPILMPYLCCC